MEEIIHLQPSDIEGTWKVHYSAKQQGFESNADPDEQATIILQSGIVSGSDPFGGIYQGQYSLIDGRFTATVKVTTSDDEGETVFDGVDFPFSLKLSGEYTSPDYISMLGEVVDQPEQQIIINCRRDKGV